MDARADNHCRVLHPDGTAGDGGGRLLVHLEPAIGSTGRIAAGNPDRVIRLRVLLAGGPSSADQIQVIHHDTGRL